MDALEILSLSSRGMAYQRGGRLRFWAMAIACGIILLASAVGLVFGSSALSPYSFSTMGLTSTTQLARWTGENWSPVDLPQGCQCPYPSFLTDNVGTLWLNALPSGLYPYRDGTWGDSYISFNDDDIPTTVAIDGDDVWGALYPELVHYDGETWTRITSPLPEDDYVLDIAINGDTVVLLGYLTIAVYQEDEWTTTPLTQALPDIVNEENFFSDEVYPQLLAAPDGSFWLSFYGVYHSVDGVTWTLVLPITGNSLYSTVLLNADSQGVWITRDGGVEHITAGGEQIARFTAEDIRLGEDDEVMSGSMSDDSGVLSTIMSLYVYDGETWQIAPIVKGQTSYVNTVALDNDGTALASAFVMPAAYTSGDVGALLLSSMLSPALTSLTTIISMTGLFILPIADILFRYTPKYLSDRNRWIETQRVLDTLGVERPQKTLVAHSLVVGFFGALSNGIWILLVIGGVTLLFSGLTAPAGAIPNLLPLYSEFAGDGITDPDEEEAAMLSGLASSPLFAGGISPLFGLLTVVGYLLARLMQGGIRLGDRTSNQILRWALEGKYDEALKSTATPGADDKPIITQPYLHLYTLYLAGRYDEAEVEIRKYLPAWRLNDPRWESALLGILGLILRYRGDYDAALRYHRASLMIRPENSLGYSTMADTMALAGFDPVLTLYTITEAEGFRERRSPFMRGLSTEIDAGGEAEFMASLAWMLARDGQSAAAEAAINWSLMMVPLQLPLFAASVHLLTGRARLAMGDRDGARKHFETTIQRDPNGGEGQIAREALAAMDGQATAGINVP